MYILGIRGNLFILDSESFNQGKEKKYNFVSNFNISVESSKDSNYVSNVNISVKSSKDSNLWHVRFGHPSSIVLKHVTCLKDVSSDDFFFCEVCPLAKQTRIPFHRSNSMSSDIFDLLHVDIWGPYRQLSIRITGAFYFLTIVDDYSRSTWTFFLMKTKSQTISILKNVFVMIKNQFQKNVKILGSDNGSEFLANECQDMLSELGIIHQKTCVYTPNKIGKLKEKIGILFK